jgi:RNA polymerase sigma factor (sigma-70 family)
MQMPDTSDIDLLREYAGSGSESAFEQIVYRHINLVYSVALRFTGHSEDAQDVTQAVFVILARKAAGLRPKTVVTGWLYETTRFTAMNFLTHQSRRQAREQETYMQSTLNDAETESIWTQLAPLLERAMTRLSEKERTLVALRFFENKSFAETAALAGMNEGAARKRVERTLEKLRAHFSKHGVNSTAATIAGAISANSVHAAPAMLAKSVSAVAAAKGATASISTSTLIKGALKIMAWTKAKTAIVTGVVVLLATGTTTLVVVKNHSAANGSRLITGTNPGDFAPDKVSFLAQMSSVKGTVIPAFIQYAREHNDDIPASMADLQPYLPPGTSVSSYDNWEILATGKFTPQLQQHDTILLQQKSVPAGQYRNLRIVGYTDGHLEARQ